MIRILHVIESLERGGAERVLATLARAMRETAEVHVVSLISGGPLVHDLRLAGAQVYTLGLESRLEFWRALRLLERLVRRLEPDIIHAHLRFSELYTSVLPRPRSARLVATFHNLGFDAAPLTWVDTTLRTVEKHLLKHRFDAFFAVSRQSADSYGRHLNLEEVAVIYNPVDIDRVRCFARHRSSRTLAAQLRERGQRLIVQVGSFRPVKGHDVMLDVLTRSGGADRLTWVCVGDGPGRAALELEARRRGLSQQIVLMGECSYDDTLGWLAEADAVIQPSRAEGVPLVLLEAMALGRPVVASRVGGIPEVLTDGETALLPPAGDAGALLACLRRILDEPGLATKLASRGKAVVENKFDAPAIARQWIDAYQRVRAMSDD